MQIVIDIDDYVYKKLMDKTICVADIVDAIKNGTPLQKGHGRLIDENDLKTLYELDDRLWWGNAVREFTDLPTIIEADRGE